jgi:hypothetical protein
MRLMLVEVAPKRPVLHLAASLYLALVEHARGILKPAALNVALMPRGLIPIVFVLLFMAVVPQPCQAQSPEPALAPPAKLSELLRLMDDPELRQWLEKRQEAEQKPSTVAATIIETEEAHARARYQALR